MSENKSNTEKVKNKERASGVWSVTNKEISFTREWRGHRFTDKEVKDLLDGKDITINGIVSQKDKSKYGVTGHLANLEYNGVKFIGFDMTGFAGNNNGEKKEKVSGVWAVTGEEITFTRVWNGHRFTDEEVSSLLNGDTIEIENLVSKNNTIYSAKGKLTAQEYNGHPFVGFEKEETVPDSWSGHTFTDEEKMILEAGGEVEITDAVSNRTGNSFSCSVSYGEKDDGKKGIIANFG